MVLSKLEFIVGQYGWISELSDIKRQSPDPVALFVLAI